jgi:hypothetical protein
LIWLRPVGMKERFMSSVTSREIRTRKRTRTCHLFRCEQAGSPHP